MSSPATIDLAEYPYVRLASGEYSVEISTYGGGLRVCEYGGKPLVESYPRGDVPPLSSNAILAPWTNRTEDGAFDFAGQSHQLDINEPARTNAIHGFVRSERWDIRESTNDHAVLECVITPRNGWPWKLTLTVDYLLTPQGLRVTYEVTNVGDDAAPFALGVHTYPTLFGAAVDDCVVSVPVDMKLELDPTRLLPTGEETKLATVPVLSDLLEGLALAGVLLDDCFHASDKEDDDRVTVLRHRDEGVEKRRVVMSTSANLPWFQIFTADPAAGHGYPGRGRALAVEPMSAPPNALRSGRDVVVLQPGEKTQFHWGIKIEE